MNPPILNRAGGLPEDGWYQIEASGEHINHAAKVVQVIDATAVASIVNRFNAAARANANFAGQRIDRDHLSQSMENPTEALGWAMQLRNSNGIPEAKIDWTSLGRPLVEGKVYKFFSTEYEPADCEALGERTVNGKSYKLVRPLVLAGLALTNDPNNKGQKPIMNRASGDIGAGALLADADALRVKNRAFEIQKLVRDGQRVYSFGRAFTEAAAETSSAEDSRAQQIKNRAREIQGQKSSAHQVYPFAQAFREATAEIPAIQ
jgi:hypothetical protein